MNHRNTYIAVGLIVLILIVGYFAFMNKTPVTTTPPEATSTDVTLPPVTQPVTSSYPLPYKNIQYGFTMHLPSSWQGYTIVETKWQGVSIATSSGEKLVAEGPMVSIRHPLWTASTPRQDIPVMVFTLSQWADLQAEKFHIGAAPIGPSELGRNSKYVFALPARYNFAFQPGYEEVRMIIDANNPLETFNP